MLHRECGRADGCPGGSTSADSRRGADCHGTPIAARVGKGDTNEYRHRQRASQGDPINSGNLGGPSWPNASSTNRRPTYNSTALSARVTELAGRCGCLQAQLGPASGGRSGPI